MCLRRVIWLVSIVFVGAVRADEPDPELVFAEKTLTDAAIKTDGPSLVRFFRDRTPSETELARLTEAVRRLGDDDFETREKASEELIRAGRRALPHLKPAVRDADRERSRRAEHCIEEIAKDRNLQEEAVVAAARVLAERRPEGAVAALLDYLPAADEERIEDAILKALLIVGVKDGQPDPVLTKALTDKHPLRRAAAAHSLGRTAPEQRAAVRRLFTDAEARVRFEAAAALMRAGDKEAMPVLFALVGEGPMPLGWRAQELLFRIAGDKAPMLALTEETPDHRVKVADAWRDWWKEAGPTTDLAKIKLDEALLGLNVFVEGEGVGGGIAWASRADGKPLWKIKDTCGSVDIDVLPNGHILLAEWQTQSVTEYDREGKMVWTKKVGNYPTTCRRLPNGNTFIATFSELMEVDPKGTQVYTYKNPQNALILRAHRFPNGHLLFASAGGKVVELDNKGQQVRVVKMPSDSTAWMSIQPLPGDRFLIGLRGENRVIEIDGTGKLLWECKATDPMSSVRLPNGNTLVACSSARTVIEVDRAGKGVWTLKLERGVYCVRRF